MRKEASSYYSPLSSFRQTFMQRCKVFFLALRYTKIEVTVELVGVTVALVLSYEF